MGENFGDVTCKVWGDITGTASGLRPWDAVSAVVFPVTRLAVAIDWPDQPDADKWSATEGTWCSFDSAVAGAERVIVASGSWRRIN